MHHPHKQLFIGWRGGTIGRATDLRFTGRRFESRLGTIAWWPRTSYLHMRACHQAVSFATGQRGWCLAGKV